MNTPTAGLALLLAAQFALALPAAASVTEFTSFNQWHSATSSYTAIGFTDLPEFSFVTTQYASLGVIFPDGFDFIIHGSSYPQDGAGLNGRGNNTITMQFAEERRSVAAYYPGSMQVRLYSHGTLIYMSDHLLPGPGGLNGFYGVISTQSFDKVQMADSLGGMSIDNLYFGPPIPAPAVLPLLGLGLLTPRRRRA